MCHLDAVRLPHALTVCLCACMHMRVRLELRLMIKESDKKTFPYEIITRNVYIWYNKVLSGVHVCMFACVFVREGHVSKEWWRRKF